MKFLKAEKNDFVFQIGKREKRLLFDVLALYPVIPSAHHRLSKGENPAEILESQKLLEEALAAQKQENRKQLLAFLQDEARFQEHSGGFHFRLPILQIEWLLQVLNDIRVGSWLTLGCPDEKHGKFADSNEQNTRHYLAMEFCGLLETVLLEALHRRP